MPSVHFKLGTSVKVFEMCHFFSPRPCQFVCQDAAALFDNHSCACRIYSSTNEKPLFDAVHNVAQHVSVTFFSAYSLACTGLELGYQKGEPTGICVALIVLIIKTTC